METHPDPFPSLALTGAPRLFVPAPLVPGQPVSLPATTAHHALKVLRLRAGDDVTLFNGEGGEYAGRLLDAGQRGAAMVELRSFAAVERESLLPIRLVQCLQGGDKMDFTIQKAVELGVADIVPVIGQRSVVRLDGERAGKRVEHWRQVVISASEQCGRNRLAAIAEIQPLDRWLAQPARDDFVRLILSPHATTAVGGLFGGERPRGVELLIGPEGGLSPGEVEAALLRNFCKLRLGPRVLRTETAALAVIAALHAHWGDFI